MKNKGIYLILTICYILIIFYLSSLPGSSLTIGTSKTERVFWNLGHIPFYGILALLLTITLRNKKKANSGFLKSNWLVLIIAVGIAILDEINQARVPGRSASIIDILFDSIGIITALWITRIC
ncbi:MAG: VanZ family protein [Nitrospirota bacterium]